MSTVSTPPAASPIDALPPTPLSAAARRRVGLLIFVLFLLAGAFFHHLVEYDNTTARYLLLSAVVDRGTLNVDPWKDASIDLSLAGGHYYSNKAIGAPLLGVPGYWLLQHATPIGAQPKLAFAARYWVKVLTTTLPFALVGVVLWGLALAWGAPPRAALAMVLSYGLGTISFIHAQMYSGHGPSAAFGFFGFALLAWPRAATRGGRALGLAAAAGLCAGLSVLCDYLAGIIAVALALYLLGTRRPWPQVAAYLAGGAVCAAVLAGYNMACFGAPWRLSYGALAHAEFAGGAAGGFFGVRLPDPWVALKLLASPAHGLFFTMPVLLLGLLGLAAWWRPVATPGRRAAALLCGGVALVYWLANAGFYGWHGGWAFGPRYLTGMLPFLAFPLAFAVVRERTWALLFALSALQVLAAGVIFPHVPDEIRNPLPEFILPMLGYGYLAENVVSWLGGPAELGAALFLLLAGGLSAWAWRLTAPADEAPPTPTGRGWLAGVVGAWLLLFALGLAFPTPAADLHAYRAHLLIDAARNSGDRAQQQSWLVLAAEEQAAAAR